MSEGRLHLELISPEAILFSQEVEMVTLPALEGDMGVLPGHMPLITTLRPGAIALYENGKVNQVYFTSSGFVEVLPKGCTIFVDDLISLSDLKLPMLEQELKNLREDYEDEKDIHLKAAIEHKISLVQTQIQMVGWY